MAVRSAQICVFLLCSYHCSKVLLRSDLGTRDSSVILCQFLLREMLHKDHLSLTPGSPASAAQSPPPPPAPNNRPRFHFVAVPPHPPCVAETHSSFLAPPPLPCRCACFSAAWALSTWSAHDSPPTPVACFTRCHPVPPLLPPQPPPAPPPTPSFRPAPPHPLTPAAAAEAAVVTAAPPKWKHAPPVAPRRSAAAVVAAGEGGTAAGASG